MLLFAFAFVFVDFSLYLSTGLLNIGSMAAAQAQAPLCAINFANMAEYLYNDLAEGVGAAARCLACRHPVFEHVAAQAAIAQPRPPAAVPDPLLRVGPCPGLNVTPAEQLRFNIQNWQDSGRVRTEDRDRWTSSFSLLKAALFDGHAQDILENIVAEGTGASRKFRLREGVLELPRERISQIGSSFRRAHYVGIALYHILRAENRHLWKDLAKPGYVLRAEVELPVTVFTAEQALAEPLHEIPGQLLPRLDQIQDSKYPIWLGVFAATIPIDTFQSSIEQAFKDVCAAWKTANPGAFCNPFERTTELERRRPLHITVQGNAAPGYRQQLVHRHGGDNNRGDDQGPRRIRANGLRRPREGNPIGGRLEEERDDHWNAQPAPPPPPAAANIGADRRQPPDNAGRGRGNSAGRDGGRQGRGRRGARGRN